MAKSTLPQAPETFLSPLVASGRIYYGFIGLLLALIGVGLYAYATQLTEGLVVTGMRSRVMWGLYITNFVFFIGISHAGTLISAILRVTNTEWRRPITRMAEAITVFALVFGASSIIFDLGRPDRILNLLLYGKLDSPLIWDLISITTYLTGSIIYLYLPLIPDIAELRDRSIRGSRFKRWLYTRLGLGWRDTATQRARLEKAIKIMAVIIIPVAVSVHTVVSWVFGMTLRPGWHSTIFGPYFVVGAIFSGIASIIMAMAVFRRIYRLEDFLTLQHFKYLGYMLLTLNIAYIYFTISEFLTSYYGGKPEEVALLNSLFTGGYAPMFWTFAIAGLILPALLVGIPRTRTVLGITIAATLVNVGMWYKRFVIIVPALARPSMPGSDWAAYMPTLVEFSITAASVAGFVLLFALFAKLFPIISMWEIREGRDKLSNVQSQEADRPATARWLPNSRKSSLTNISKRSIFILLVLIASLYVLPLSLASPFNGSDAGPLASMRVEAAQGDTSGAKSFVIVVSKNGFNGTASSNLHITVSEGNLVQITFIMDPEDRKDTSPNNRHILEISGYEIRTEEISPSHPTATLVFLADKVGTFAIRCGAETWDCPGHEFLVDGKFTVNPIGEVTTTTKVVKTELNLDVGTRCFPVCSVTLIATLVDSEGKPIAGMPVGFYVNTTFGTMKIGSAYTDTSGIASLNYTRTIGGVLEFSASFPGGGGYEASTSRVVIQLPTVVEKSELPLLAVGNVPLGVLPLLTAVAAALTVRNVAAGMTMVVVLSVWGTYLVVLRQLRAIARDAKDHRMR